MKRAYIVIERFNGTISCIGVFKSLKKAKKAIRKIAKSNGIYFQETLKDTIDPDHNVCYKYRYLDFTRTESIYTVVKYSIDTPDLYILHTI